MEENVKILLLGGDGFLGKGLQRELVSRKIAFRSLDMKDVDLTDPDSVGQVALEMTGYSHIVLLASVVGIDVFNTEPEYGGAVNRQICQNFKKELSLVHELSGSWNLDVAFYSTSEVFGGMRSRHDFITNDSPYRFDTRSKRYLYSKIKADVENDLKDMRNSGKIGFLKILRPFNVSGKGQRRGVVYEMVKSGMLTGKVKYMRDTTRSITDVDSASRKSVDCILSRHDVYENIVDDCSVELKTIAERVVENISRLYGRKIELEELNPDPYMRYRQVSEISYGDRINRKLDKIINDILAENGWKN